MKKFLLTVSIFLFVLISNAQITFQKTYGGVGNEVFYDAQITTDSGYIMIGTTSSFAGGSTDIYVVKTNAGGDVLWTKTYGDTSNQVGYSIRQTIDGGFIVAGTTHFAITMNRNILLIKINNLGDTLWTKTFDNFMSDFNVNISSIEQTSDTGFILSGWDFRMSWNVNYSFIMKTDVNGNFSWLKTFSTTGSASGIGGSACQTTEGGYIHTGEMSQNGNGDAYLIKTDSLGNKIWGKIYNEFFSSRSNVVKQTDDGGYILVGTKSFLMSHSNAYVIKTDSAGNIVWLNNYGGNNIDGGAYINETNDGGYIVSGYSTSFGAGNGDIYLIKINANGNLLWSKTFGGSNGEWGGRVFRTWDGGYIIAGTTGSFGAGINDFYLIKTDSLGDSGCNQTNVLTVMGQDSTNIINTAPLGNNIFNQINFPPIVLNNTIGGFSVLCTTGEAEESANNSISFLIYPNPSSENFIISFDVTIMKGNVEILNILGENVFAENIFNESKKEISLKNITQGIYFVKVFDGEKSYCKKIIVE